jgi:hypothetical protein
MLCLYRNRGAAWVRADGTRIERGAEFVPTHDELLRRAYKLEYAGPAGGFGPDPAPLPGTSRDVEDYATGHGWYLIDGCKVQGREAAEAALRELRGA